MKRTGQGKGKAMAPRQPGLLKGGGKAGPLAIKQTFLKASSNGKRIDTGKGGVKGGGKGGGKGGAWVWIPSGGAPPAVAKAKAKSKADRFKEKLSTIDPSLKVWVGGLGKGVTWQMLQKHFEEVAKPDVTDVNEKKGTACVAFKATEDVTMAVEMMNGSELNGQTLEVDVWTKPVYEKDGGETTRRQRRRAKKQMQKKKPGATKSPVDEKIKEKLKTIDESCKVWVGGLTTEVTWKDLEQHFAQVSKPMVTDVRKSSACVAFGSEDEAQAAIATLNASELKGNILEVDVWTKPVREKKIKKEQVSL